MAVASGVEVDLVGREDVVCGRGTGEGRGSVSGAGGANSSVTGGVAGTVEVEGSTTANGLLKLGSGVSCWA